MVKNLLAGIRSKDTRILSQVITAVENGDPSVDSLLRKLYPYCQETVRIGITGPPGSGKSTLIDKLITEFRNDGKSVGCITIDPTSPFSGGALLGDRVRMNAHTLDPMVYIRSMGSRGETGGLAKKTMQVADVIASTGKDILLFETVGIGQIESKIVGTVDITVVILVPEAGDEIQFMKAGPIEIGDLFVINKADREGADNIAKSLRYFLETNSHKSELIPYILLTIAKDGTGINDLYSECMSLVEKLKTLGIFEKRRKKHYIEQIRSMVKDELLANFWSSERNTLLNAKLDEFRDKKISPYQAATRLMESLTH